MDDFCDFCKKLLNEGDKVFPAKNSRGEDVLFHQQCYEFRVMNYGSPTAIELYWEYKDKIPLYKKVNKNGNSKNK